MPRFRTRARPWPAAGGVAPAAALVAGVLLVAGWLAWPDAAEPAARPPVFLAGPSGVSAGPLYQPSLRWAAAARTDAGRTVNLWEPAAPRPAAEVGADEGRMLAGFGLAPRLTRRGPAAEAYNCHGWLFADGRYWVLMADVELILIDNGYRPVAVPQPGDVAVYRDAAGGIAHTALVRRAGEPVVVEGKWAWLGRFEHAVGDSPFGQAVTYYRTARSGHLLVGAAGDGPDRHPGPIPNR